jgi:arginyl-tRNA synthetase
MVRARLSALVAEAVERLVRKGALPYAAYPEPEIAEPRNPEHGDLACNWAMAAARQAGADPRALAAALAAELAGAPEIAGAEVAGPGFLNLRLSAVYLAGVAARVAADPDLALRSAAMLGEGGRRRINVEFVSVNPNGPVTVGSGRGAAYGSALCNALEAAGHTVHREYYVNDGVNSEQMRLFAASVRALALGEPLPEGGYRGDYVQSVADALRDEAAGKDLARFKSLSEALIIAAQRDALRAFGVEFDTWFSEQSLHDSGAVERALDALARAGAADERPFRAKLKLGKGGRIEDVEIEEQPAGDEEDGGGEGPLVAPALWLRSTKFGDDMDRVLRRGDGRLTYIASDLAYHADKFGRPPGADLLVTILGPDHHGYIGRLQAVVAAMLLAGGEVPAPPGPSAPLSGVESRVYASPAERDLCLAALSLARERLVVRIFQLVRFLKDGRPAPMRKRDGNIYALTDLMREIGEKAAPGDEAAALRAGRDVARFFYLMRSHDTTFDFDLDLAGRQSDENPVFYVQYAHARICSILARAAGMGLRPAGERAPAYDHPKELALIRKIADLPWEVQRCAADHGVHRLTAYAIELARQFHLFYEACRVLSPEEPVRTRDRLVLCEAARAALGWSLELLGVSAPERM